MSRVCPSSLRTTNDALPSVQPHIGVRLFVVALAVMTGPRYVPAEPPLAESGQPVVLDEAAAPKVPTQAASHSPARTPIRRAADAQAAPGERMRPSSLASTLALLGLVLGGAYVALNMLRRRHNVRSAQPQAIDLLASCRLDGQSTLHLVQIGRRVLAVGSSAGGARTLAVIEDPEEIAQLISTSGHRGRNCESPVHSSPAVAEPGGRGSRRAERAWTTGHASASAGASPSQCAGPEGMKPPPVGLGGMKRSA